MAQYLGTEVIIPVWCKKLYQLEGEDLRRETRDRLAPKLAELENDCSSMMERLLELGDKWKELAPDWDTFCLEFTDRPAAFIDTIVNGVRALREEGYQGRVPLQKAIDAARAMPLAKHGEIGNGRESKGNYVTSTRGNNSEYLLRRLARDCPEMLERLEAGQFRSVHQAAIAAGIIKVPSPLDVVMKAYLRLDAEGQQQFNDWLKSSAV